MESIVNQWNEDFVKQCVAESSSLKELQIKLGYSANSGKVDNTIMKYCAEHDISLANLFAAEENKPSTKRTEANVFCEGSTASQATLRRWYIKGEYTPYKCAICGQEPIWNGKPLTLTLDHINGVNTDDRLENLRWVCPNCDRQLDTFGSKNASFDMKRSKKKIFYCENCGKEVSFGSKLCFDCEQKRKANPNKPSAEDLVELLKSYNGNFTAVGKTFGLTDNAIRRWCKSYGLPYHSGDYRTK